MNGKFPVNPYEAGSDRSPSPKPLKGINLKYFKNIHVHLGRTGKTVKAMIPRPDALNNKELKGLSMEVLKRRDNVLFSLEEVMQYASFKDNTHAEYRYAVRSRNKKQLRKLNELPDEERSITVLLALKDADELDNEHRRAEGTLTEMRNRRGLTIAQQLRRDKNNS